MKNILFNTAVEFGPVIFFIGTYLYASFFTAVTVTIGATITAVGAALLISRRVAWFPIMSALGVVTFGGISLYIENESVFMLYDTLANAVFAILLFGSLYINKPALKPLFEHLFALTDQGWRILTRRWALFYLLVTLGFEVMRNFATIDMWVLYKGSVVVATTVFGCYQFFLAHRLRIPEESNNWGLRTKPIIKESK